MNNCYLLYKTIYANPEDAQKDGRFRDSAKRTYYFNTTIDGEGLDMRVESRDARVMGEYERIREGRCLCSMRKQNIALHSVVRLAGAKRGAQAGDKGLKAGPRVITVRQSALPCAARYAREG